MRPAMLPTSTPARHALKPPRALHVGEAPADQALPAGPAREPRRGAAALNGAPRHTMRPRRAGSRVSSIAQIKHAAQAVADEMHGVAGHAVENSRERRGVGVERARRRTDS